MGGTPAGGFTEMQKLGPSQTFRNFISTRSPSTKSVLATDQAYFKYGYLKSICFSLDCNISQTGIRKMRKAQREVLLLSLNFYSNDNKVVIIIINNIIINKVVYIII